MSNDLARLVFTMGAGICAGPVVAVVWQKMGGAVAFLCIFGLLAMAFGLLVLLGGKP